MRIGWIGTGNMGAPMCEHILGAGHDIFIYSRTKERAQKLLDRGARWCESVKTVTEKSEIIFLMVGYPEDVKAITDEIFVATKTGCILVDMTTSDPTLAKDIYEKGRVKGLYVLDAPVSGGVKGAKAGSLSIMVGGDKTVFEKVNSLFSLMGETITYTGGAGSGQHTKMCNQIANAANIIGVVETLLYAKKAGLDVGKTVGAVKNGAAASWMMSIMAPKILEDDFSAGFFLKHFLKDLKIALAECERMNLELPFLKQAVKFYKIASERGYDDLGFQAIYKVLEEL